MMKSMFGFKPKSERIARIISIKSPAAFKQSIKELEKGGLTAHEKRALVLAQNRAAAQLKRANLSGKERKEFSRIAGMRLPKLAK